jgi:hypothetical protein
MSANLRVNAPQHRARARASVCTADRSPPRAVGMPRSFEACGDLPKRSRPAPAQMAAFARPVLTALNTAPAQTTAKNSRPRKIYKSRRFIRSSPVVGTPPSAKKRRFFCHRGAFFACFATDAFNREPTIRLHVVARHLIGFRDEAVELSRSGASLRKSRRCGSPRDDSFAVIKGTGRLTLAPSRERTSRSSLPH